MPVSGPIPGSTPTTVPTRQPRNAYHSTSGCSATEKPSSKLSTVPIPSSVEGLRIHPLDPAEAGTQGHTYQLVVGRLESASAGMSGEPNSFHTTCVYARDLGTPGRLGRAESSARA